MSKEANETEKFDETKNIALSAFWLEKCYNNIVGKGSISACAIIK